MSMGLNGYCNANILEAVTYFRGPAATALINEYFGNNIPLARYYRAVLILRLQYLDLFTIHYPITSYCPCFQHFALCIEIGSQCYNLRRQILENKVGDYIETSRQIVYLIDEMYYVMRQHQMVWFSCYRCIFSNAFRTTYSCPLIKCMALKYDVSNEIVAKMVGTLTPWN